MTFDVLALPQGHTGNVRLLVSTDTEAKHSLTSTPENESRLDKRESEQRCTVISAGEGLEDNGSVVCDQQLGNDDSTNYLLLWKTW